jgi:hypothetical protein
MEKLNPEEVKEFMKWKKSNVVKAVEVKNEATAVAASSRAVSIDASSVQKVKKEKRKGSEKQLAALAAGRQKQIEKMLALATHSRS